jgi:tRNA nucleotidyltransferase/poly(A) polymerase
MGHSKLLENRITRAVDKPMFNSLSISLKKMGLKGYLVGGYVRDVILQRPTKDVDIVVVGSGIEAAQQCALDLNAGKVKVFKNFGTAAFKYKDTDIEFVGARKESYQRDSRKPIIEDGTLQDDQNRRDFTINAMAISLNAQDFGQLLDPFDGLEDLNNQIIKTPLDPAITYSDDPLRMMRAVRFASQLGFTIEEKSFQAICNQHERLDIISKERITEELNKIILSPTPSLGFKLLYNSKLLHQFFPEMVNLQGVETRNGISHKDNFYHTLEVLDNVSNRSDDLWLRWAAIMHDIAKPPTKRFNQKGGWTFHGHEDLGSRWVPKIFKRLKLPLDHKMKFVQKMVFLHLRPIALTKEIVTDSAIRRLIFEAGEDIDKLMALCESDITSKNEKKVKLYLQRFEEVRQKIKDVEERDKIRNWQPPITGEIIMKTFDMKPSKAIGDLKSLIKEAILDGEIPNNYEDAYNFMLEKGVEMGLQIRHKSN